MTVAKRSPAAATRVLYRVAVDCAAAVVVAWWVLPRWNLLCDKAVFPGSHLFKTQVYMLKKNSKKHKSIFSFNFGIYLILISNY